jgi:uncharacterized protein with WD repeat
MRNAKISRIIRFILLVGLTTLFTGMIVHSASNVRYDVGSEKLSEFTVTELSLTHSIERGENGKLINLNEESKAPDADGNRIARLDSSSGVVMMASAKSAPAKKTAAASSKKVVKAPAKKAPAKKAPAKKPAKKEEKPKASKKKPCPT